MPFAILSNPLSLKMLIEIFRMIELFSGALFDMIREASSLKVTSFT